MPLDSGQHTARTRERTLRLLLGDQSQAGGAARAIADEAGWLGVVSLCSDWASLPALRRRIEELGISMDDAARDRLRPWANEVFLRSASCLSAGARALAALGTAGVDAVPIKGVAAIAALYRGPQDRTIGDADLLVRSRDVETALAALGTIGFTSRLDTPIDEYVARARRFPRAGNRSLAVWNEADVEVDLHWHLGPIDVETVLAASRPAVIYGRAVRVPNVAHGVLLTAHHLLRNQFEMDRSLRDLTDCRGWVAALAAGGDLGPLIQASADWRLKAPMLAVLRILTHFQPAGPAAAVWPELAASMSGSERRQSEALAECFFLQVSDHWNVDIVCSLHATTVVQFLRRAVIGRASYTAEQGSYTDGRTVTVPLWKRAWRIVHALPRTRWRLVWALKGARDHAFWGSDTADHR